MIDRRLRRTKCSLSYDRYAFDYHNNQDTRTIDQTLITFSFLLNLSLFHSMVDRTTT